MIKKIIYTLFCLLAVAGCKIENDIPYPIVEGNILSMEVEGQRASSEGENVQAVIDKKNRTVQLYVDDSVDLSKLRITKLTVSDGVELVADPAVCNNFSKFPTAGFESLESIPISSDTRVNFSQPVTFTLHTYQEYVWTVTVTQVISRKIVLENQIGKAVVDEVNRNVVVYVAKEQPLNAIKVTSFQLGGEHGKIVPDPTAVPTFDFSVPRAFFVSYGWEEVSHEWKVFVYHSEESGAISAEVFPMTIRAIVSGDIQNGKTPQIEYKKQAESAWNRLPASAITVNGTSYTASLSGLSAATAYHYRVGIDGTMGDAKPFVTATAAPLTDGSFDHWHQNGKVWNPWASDATSYWDTGNKGATTIGSSNSVPTDETSNGTGQAALLESKFLVMQFAAGNIFTGSYVRTTGMNGVLSFGRPFTSFPSKLRIHYKYTSAPIDRVGDDEFQYLKGRPDSCDIYIALTDWDEPLEIRTRPSERQLFDKNDKQIIAYAGFTQGSSLSTYQQIDLPLVYRYTNRTPKYIVVVATASKYGDYFTGGTGSKLWIDNFELIYE
ncbi:PCMD domain-containing protein [Proteiniphilum sp. UBA5384]|uniref:PCMD domain-containing protein n=1 Tax=Proteiniphilum sp. UBA5384 TaxID=1947279 RepID=UPI0025F6714B|nr:PCMD domain-containing protein [Proteiniphilum sp. UBA5384]